MKILQLIGALAAGALQIYLFALLASLVHTSPQEKEKVDVDLIQETLFIPPPKTPIPPEQVREVIEPKLQSVNLNFAKTSHNLQSDFGDLVALKGKGGDLSKGIGNGVGNTLLDANQVDTPPKVLREAQVEYPWRAEREGVSGEVTVYLEIGVRGTVEIAKVIQSSISGFGFEKAALKAAKGMKFTPPQNQGVAVRVKRSKTFTFEVDE